MKNRNDLIAFFNIMVVLIHFSLIGIIISKPFIEIVNLILAIFISVLLMVFSYLADKKLKSDSSKVIYHLVGCWSLIVTYFYFTSMGFMSYLDLQAPIYLAIFFLLLSILAMLSAIRLKVYTFIHVSYISIILMFLSILYACNIEKYICLIIITLIISILDIVSLYKSKENKNILSVVTFILTLVFTLLMKNANMVSLLGFSLIVLSTSFMKIFILKEKKEHNYIGFKLMLLMYITSSLIDNSILSFIMFYVSCLGIYLIINKKANINKITSNILFIFMTLLTIYNVSTFSGLIYETTNIINHNYYIIYLILAIGYALCYFQSKDNKLLKCISICLTIIYSYNYLNYLITNDNLKQILSISVMLFIGYKLMNYLFKDDKNKDAFISIIYILVFLNAIETDSLLVNGYLIILSIIAIYIGYIYDSYKGLKISAIVLTIFGSIRLIGQFTEINSSIYLLVLALVISIYLFNKLNNKNYCKYCGSVINDDSKYCEHCGKKI